MPGFEVLSVLCSLDTVVLLSKNDFEEVGRTHCLRQVCVDDPILERNVKISTLSVSLAFSIVIILRQSKSLDQTSQNLMHWRPELAYLPCLLNLKRRRSSIVSAKAKVLAGVCIFFLGRGDRDFFT